MPDYGVTPAGFVAKPLEDIVADLETSVRAELGESTNTSPQSFVGQIIGIVAGSLADLWNLGEAVYQSFTTDAAADTALVDLCALTGTIPKSPERSSVFALVTGTAGTNIPAETILSVGVGGAQFRTKEAAALPNAWEPSTSYLRDSFVTNGGRSYRCQTAGTSASSGGPSGTGEEITDGTVVWNYVGEGVCRWFACESVEYGPIAAPAGTLITIVTPVSGLTSVTNPDDATLGFLEETDAQLRGRREQEQGSVSDGPLEAIKRAVRAIPGITAVAADENTSNTTSANGLPPHSFEIAVDDDGTRNATELSTAIAQAIWDNRPGGIAPYGDGSDSGTATDENGFQRTVPFTRVQLVNLYIRFHQLAVDGDFPADGVEQVKAAAVEAGNSAASGKRVYALPIISAALSIPGVRGVLSAGIGTEALSLDESWMPALRQRGVFDVSRVTVTTVSG